MKRALGNKKTIVGFVLSAAFLLLLFSCTPKDDSDPHDAFLRAASVLFVNCSDVTFDTLERYEDAEFNEVYYYFEVKYEPHYEDRSNGATSGIIHVFQGGSWDFYHSSGFEWAGKEVYTKYQRLKNSGFGGPIMGEDLEILTQRINDELQKALAEKAD